MQEPKDYVLVNGSFYSNSHESYYDSLDSSKQLLKNGTLEVKGNFIQGAIANYVDQNGISRQHTTATNNFPATGNHKVILSGDPSNIQYVTFKNYDDNPSNGSSINILILTNPMASYVFNPSKVWKILSSPESKDNITTTTEDSLKSVTEMTYARKNAGAVLVEGKIFAFGGIGINNTTLKSVEKYDPLRKQWVKRTDNIPWADLLQAKSNFAASAVNSQIYIFGGSSDGATIKSCEIYNTKDDQTFNSSELITENNIPDGLIRQDHTAVLVNGKIYIIGGRKWDASLNKFVYLNSIYVFNPDTRSFTLSNYVLNTSRSSFGVNVVDDKIYIYGGMTNNGTSNIYLNTVEVLNTLVTPTSQTPCQLLSSPKLVKARAFFGYAAVNGIAYALGGTNGTILDSIEEYRTLDATISDKTAKLNTAIRDCAAVSAYNKIFIIGGTSNGSNVLNQVTEYIPQKMPGLKFPDKYLGRDKAETRKMYINDHVNIVTGNYMEQAQDVKIDSSGIDITLDRTYNSASNTDLSPIGWGVGKGWKFNFQTCIEKLDSMTTYKVKAPHGLNVRKASPQGNCLGLSGQPIISFADGSIVTTVDASSVVKDGYEWVKIRYENQDCFIAKNYLTRLPVDGKKIAVNYPTGSRDIFEETSYNSGKFVAYGNFDKFSYADESGVDTYKLLNTEEDKLYVYRKRKDNIGRLEEISDKYGNKLFISYSDTVLNGTTTYSNNIKSVYEAVYSNGSTFNGRKIVFDIDTVQINGKGYGLVKRVDIKQPGTVNSWDPNNDVLISSVNYSYFNSTNTAETKWFNTLKSVTDLNGVNTSYSYVKGKEGYLESLTTAGIKKYKITYDDIMGRIITKTDAVGNTEVYQYNDVVSEESGADVPDSDESNLLSRHYFDKNGKHFVTNYSSTEMKPSKEIYREDNGSNDTVITSNKYEIFYKSKGIWIDLSKVQKGNTDYTNYMNAITEAQNDTGNVKVRETTTDIYGNVTTIIKDELGYVNTKTLTPYSTSKTIVNEYKYVDYLFESAFSATPNVNLKDRNIQYENLKENNKYLSSTKYTYDNNNVKLRYKSELQNLNLMAINQGNWNFDTATLDSDPNIITTESKYYDDDPAYGSYRIKGLIKEIITPLKGKTSYTYEPKDFYNVKSIAQAIDTNQNSTKEILRYDWAGRKMLERSPLGYTTQYVYDNTGRLLKTTKSGNGKNSITRVIYDDLGRVVQEISPNLYDTNKDVLNASANQSSYDDSTVGKRYKYNNDGTVSYVIDPDGSTTYYKYDGNGNVSFEIKSDGSKYSYEYDWKNRKVTVQFADPDSLELYTLKKYSYQTENGINKETETEFFSSDLNDKAVTSRLYDYAGRKIRQDNPDLGIVTATYDALGRTLTQSDANNTLNASQQPVYKYKTYYNYDFDVTNKCRIAEMWEPYRVDNSTTPETIKYKYSKTIYDNAGRILKTLAENDNVGTTINESDISDYTKSSIRPTSSVAVSTNQYYYNGWLKESVEGISGKRTSFTYNNDGTVLSENRYASIGPDRIYKTEYSSNYLGKVSVENVYVNAGEIAYSDSNATTNTNAVILKTEHDYDLNGNVISDISYEKENKTDPTNRIIKTTYGYDKMDRQISKLQYGKKADGNTDVSINSVLYNWQGNPVTTTNANGNTTKLEYNSRGFKTRVVSGLSVVGIKDTGSYIESSGFWSDSKYSGYRSEKARKAINSGAKSSWTATLPSEGNYNVYVLYPYDVDNTSNAQYSITASDGNYSITVDQKQNAGTWVLVGTYNFSKSNGKVSAVVSLTSGAGMTHADSIMFEPSVSRETALGVSDSSYKEISATNSWRDAAYAGYKADNARYTSNQGDQAIWNVTLPVEGSYRVLVKYGGDAYNTTNALYTINNSDISSNINVNQQYNIGKWVSLGTYNIVKGTDGKINASITLTAGIGNTQADAIMFEPRIVNAYSYDLAGRLIAEVSPENYDSTQTDARSMNNRYEYTYDPSGRNLKKLFIGNEKKVILNTLVLSDVYITSYSKTYDKNGNILTECDAGGYNTKYTYTPQNKIETVLDPVNSDNGLAYSKKYVYDTVGRIYTETNCKKASDYDEGKKESVLHYKYDNVLYNGNIQKTKITKSYYNFDPITKVASTPAVLEINTYGLEGNVISRVDGNGYETLFEYNALSKVKKATTPGDITVQSNVTNYYYDLFGNVRKQLYDKKYPNNTKAETVIDISTYDDWGRLTAHTRMNAAGSYKITETSGYDRNGNKLFYKDGVQNANTDQNQTNFSYDQYNRLISKTLQVKCYDKDSATGLPFIYSTHTTTNTYDFNGNAIKVTQKIEYKGSSVENSSTFEFDSMNRLVRKGFISNSQSSEKTIQLLEYYWNGNQKKTYEASNNDNPSLFNVTTFEYDKNNRLTKTIDPLGVSDIGNPAHTKSQQYDNNGNVSKKIDGKGQQTIYRYDELNRLIRVETPTKVLEKYFYDRNGNIETKTDGRGLTTKYTYNAINKVATKVDNGGTGVGSRTVEYKYYSDGNLYTTKDRKNQTATLGYDIHGRLTTKVVGNISLGYGYDQNNNIVSAATSSDYFISDFDELGRVIRKSVGYGNGMLETKYIYDVVPTVSDVPSNPFITVDVSGCTAVKSIDSTNNQTLKIYDGEGRLKYVVSNNATTAYEYYRNGSLKSITYPGGTKEKYKYWEDNLLKELTNTKPVNGQDTIVDVYTYYYDGAHNQDYKLELTNNQDKGKTDYDYDELNRLKQVKEITLNRTTDYIYDNSGNRKTEVISEGVNNVTTKEYSYSDQNRLLEVAIKYNNVTKNWLGYNYDNNGNVSSVTDAVYNSSGVFVSSSNIVNTYNEIDQLTKTVNVDNTILNKYNAEGYRIVKTVTGQAPSNTRYFYENDKVVLEFNESDNTLKARNVYGTNLNSRTIDGQTLYYMYNGHGDVTALTDSAGNVAISYYYDAFGNILDRMVSSGYTNFTNSITYAGYQYDSESETKDSSGKTKTGMYYLNSRMYDPVTARFLQEDTYSGDINDPLSLNLYTYCHNDPLMYTDPTGHIAAYINGMSITMDPSNRYDTEYAKYLYSHSNKDDYSKNKKESAYRKDFNRTIAAYELKEIFKEYSKSSVKVGEGIYYDISKGFGRLGTEQTRSKQYYLMQMMLDNEIVLDNPEVAIQIASMLNSGSVMDYRRAGIIKKALANDRFFNDVVNEEKEEHDQFVKDIAEGVVETVGGLLETGAGIAMYASTPITNAPGVAAATYFTGNGLSLTAGGISRMFNAGTGKGETWNFVRNACNSISSEYGDALYFGTQLPGIAYGGYQVVKSGYQASKSLYNSWKAYKNPSVIRGGKGKSGQDVPYLTDFYPGADNGVMRGYDPPTFYSVPNKSGGKIHVSTWEIKQKHFANIIDDAEGEVHLLTGTHGDLDGNLLPDKEFFDFDFARWGSKSNVNVHDVIKMSDDELAEILNNRSGDIVAGWCRSERSIAILKALGLIE
ncbi:MAG TPA: kelch repeat-containing protein [Pseudobacteroides sp.]|uniref:golvesin C-terminal-like domain-containing protein n=1 Tax=Pseudobacteroides sp. TaxID=1968840 RepID=UPI002F929AF3